MMADRYEALLRTLPDYSQAIHGEFAIPAFCARKRDGYGCNDPLDCAKGYRCRARWPSYERDPVEHDRQRAVVARRSDTDVILFALFLAGV